MLVSEREMGLSEDHDGIIEVNADVPVGTPFAALYGFDDPVIEINLTPNRADCAGVRGVARDLAAAGLGTLRPLDEVYAARLGVEQDNKTTGAFPCPVSVTLDFAGDSSPCPHFTGRLVRNVTNGASPKWVRDRLNAVGQKSISALVDVTNYIALDLCRPLHVFDADKINGALHVRLARDGETLAALNDKNYDLADGMTAVCDDTSVLALGGIMGGAATGCNDATTSVFIESAYFDPLRTARTGRALQIHSDARYRFERGVDPAFTKDGLRLATAMILALCGGEASTVVTAGQPPSWQRTIAFQPAYVTKLTGLTIPDNAQKSILQHLGFTVETTNDSWQVQPPSWRGDIEGAADLVEEIVRVTGYDRIPTLSLVKNSAVTGSADTQRTARARAARNALAARGMQECVTWSFLSAERAALFGAHADNALRIVNPISADLTQMRASLLGNLLEAAGRNRDRGYDDTALFEVGPAFANPKANGQSLVAAGLRAGNKGPRHWSGPNAARAIDAFDAKADALDILRACGLQGDSVPVSRDAPSWYHPGRSGCIRLGPTVLAYFGEIHPGVAEAMGLRGPLAGFEVFLDAVPQPKKKPGTARPLLKLSPFQPVSRDFAFIVDATTEAESIVRAAKGADKALIANVDLFDIYTGKGVEPGKKSVAIAVTIQPKDQTLTDKELETLTERIIGQVAAKTGAALRS